MPFKSKAQKGFLYANNPKVAKKFAEVTPKEKKLPEHAPKPKKKKPKIRTEEDGYGGSYQ